MRKRTCVTSAVCGDVPGRVNVCTGRDAHSLAATLSLQRALVCCTYFLTGFREPNGVDGLHLSFSGVGTRWTDIPYGRLSPAVGGGLIRVVGGLRHGLRGSGRGRGSISPAAVDPLTC